jgi:hypothetical protein
VLLLLQTTTESTVGTTTGPEPGQLQEYTNQLLALQLGFLATLVLLVGGLLWIEIHRG